MKHRSRKRRHTLTNISFSLSTPVIEAIRAEADRYGISQSEAARMILQDGLKTRGIDPIHNTP